MSNQQIEFETGGNPWPHIAAVFAAAVAIGIAVALWQVSIGLSVGCAATGVGYGGYHLFCGIAEVIRARGDADASRINARARMIGARQPRVEIVERLPRYLEDK